MARYPSEVLSDDDIVALMSEISGDAESGREGDVLQKVQRLRDAQPHRINAAYALLGAINMDHVPVDEAVEVLSEVERSHHDDPVLMGVLGESLETIRDIDDLNAPPPEHPLFRTVVERLQKFAEGMRDTEAEDRVLRGLGTAARMCARQFDDVAERAYARLAELEPDNSSHHYNLGLFYKTRGLFAEGLAANLTAQRLAKEETESVEWNLGICATGAGDAQTALDVWKRMGQVIEMGRFLLPDGSYPTCKVKLAERPLAERSAENDDPGDEETIWIERMSPCHGIIRSVLYGDLGVDYGDVILFDGAPITYHTYGDLEVPVFPHLATLMRRGYQMFDFAGTQEEAGQLADASLDLERDCVVYSHTENYQELCERCWRDPDIDHERHDATEKHVVTGRIAAPPDVEPGYLLDQIDTALEKRDGCRLYAPELCLAAGQKRRAAVDGRRYEMLTGS